MSIATRLKIYTKITSSGQIVHAFSNHRDFILLVRIVTFFSENILNSSYTEKIKYFLNMN